MARQQTTHTYSRLVGPRTQIVGVLPEVDDPDFADISAHAKQEVTVLIQDRDGHEHFRIVVGAGQNVGGFRLYGGVVSKARILACPRPGQLAEVAARVLIERYDDSIIDRIGRLDRRDA